MMSLAEFRGSLFTGLLNNVVRQEMGEIIVKLWLSDLVAIPFVALLSDMLKRTDGLMSRAVVGVTIIFALGLVFSGFQERPNFATLVFFAFCAWLVFLLVAKAVRPSIPWRSMWVSVPIMGWFLVNLMIGLTDGVPFRARLKNDCWAN